jgi:Spy/CpxP family protein refolding chaperone
MPLLRIRTATRLRFGVVVGVGRAGRWTRRRPDGLPRTGGDDGVALELSDAQKDQMKSIARSHADEWKGLLDREQQARRAQLAAIASPQFDEVLIRQRSAELAAVDADASVARARARGELLQVLTTDQLAKLKDIESREAGAATALADAEKGCRPRMEETPKRVGLLSKVSALRVSDPQH